MKWLPKIVAPSSYMLYVMQNSKEYYFMFLLIMYLFMYKHKVDTQAIDRIKAIKLVEHCY